MPSFSTPLSGLNADSQDLSVIANNLANLNTVGYKSDVTNFQDLFYQQIGTNGAGDPIQVGVGTQISGISGNFTQGSIETTGVPTDVAIEGSGFITLKNNGLQEFTRAGDLTVAANGSLMTADGGFVQGYQAANGVINTNQTLGAISIPAGLTSPPNATSNVTLTLNLNSGTAVAPSPASQQTGTGITPATVLATGGTIAFNDGTNNFTFATSAGNTLNDVVTAINANSHFTANLSGNSLVITANNGQALANLQNQAIVNGQTPADYYAGVIFQIGNDVSQATSEQTSVSLVQQQLQDQRGAISGVSLDEEAVNLIKFQSAYRASANVISTVNTLLTALFNMMA